MLYVMLIVLVTIVSYNQFKSHMLNDTRKLIKHATKENKEAKHWQSFFMGEADI